MAGNGNLMLDMEAEDVSSAGERNLMLDMDPEKSGNLMLDMEPEAPEKRPPSKIPANLQGGALTIGTAKALMPESIALPLLAKAPSTRQFERDENQIKRTDKLYNKRIENQVGLRLPGRWPGGVDAAEEAQGIAPIETAPWVPPDQGVVTKFGPGQKITTESMWGWLNDPKQIRERGQESNVVNIMPDTGERLPAIPRAPEPRLKLNTALKRTGVLPGIMNVLDVASRGPGGAAKGMQESLQGMVSGKMDRNQAMEHLFKRTGESIINKRPAYFSDVYTDAFKTYNGTDSITTAQNIFAIGMGLAGDLAVGSKLLPNVKSVEAPRAPEIGKQIKKALKKAGASTGDITKFEHIGKRIAAIGERPTEIQATINHVKKLARSFGVDEGVAVEALMKSIGKQGEALGKGGLANFMAKGRHLEPPASKVSGMTIGQQYAGPLPVAPAARRAAGEIQWGAGTLPGVKDEIRMGQAIAGQSAHEADRGHKVIRKALGKRTEEFAQRRDAQSLLAREGMVTTKNGAKAQKLHVESSELARQSDEAFMLADDAKMRYADAERAGGGPARKEALAEIKKQTALGEKMQAQAMAKMTEAEAFAEDTKGFVESVDRALKRMGIDRSDTAFRFSPGKKGVAERAAMEGFDGFMKTRHAAMVEAGVPVGMVDVYVPHVATKAARKKMVSVTGKSDRASASMLKSRSEVPIGLGGSDKIQFEQKLEDIYSTYNQASGQVLANATAENNIIRLYGKEITGDLIDRGGHLSAEGHRMAKARGLAEYEAKAGKFAGKKFLIDEESKILLDRMIDPGNTASRIAAVDKWTVWWKARATVFRPGFTLRNGVGNIHNLWLADVKNITGAMSDAAGLQMLRYSKAPQGFMPISQSSLQRLAGRTLNENSIVRGTNLTGKQVLELAERHKVFGASFSSKDLGQVMGRVSAIPTSAKFGHMPAIAKVNQIFEENARMALFVDRLRKGHTPSEAAAAVAKYLFNYDEMSPTMQALKITMPFWTWNFKNWGLELQTLATKPKKFYQLQTTKRAIESSNPMTRQEAQFENQMEPIKGHMDILRLPFTDGEHFMLGGWLPSSSLNSLHRDRILGEIGGMLNPILNAIPHIVGSGDASDYPGYMAFSGKWPRGSLATCPTWVTSMMNGLKRGDSNKSKAAYSLMSKIFMPHKVEDKYMWHSEMANAFQGIDPGFATVNRVFRHSDEKNYDTLIATILGGKLQKYGIRKGTTDYEKKQKKASDLEKEAEKSARQLGYEQ